MRNFEIISLNALSSFLEHLAKTHYCTLIGRVSSFGLRRNIFIKSTSNAPVWIIRDLTSLILDFKKSVFGSLLDEDIRLCIAHENINYTNRENFSVIGQRDISPMIVEKYLDYDLSPEDVNRVKDFAVVLPSNYLLGKDIVLEDDTIVYAKTHAKIPNGRYLDVWNVQNDLHYVMECVCKRYGKDYNKRYNVSLEQQYLGVKYSVNCSKAGEDFMYANEFAYDWNCWLSNIPDTGVMSRYAYLRGTLLTPFNAPRINHGDSLVCGWESGTYNSHYDCCGFVAIHPSLW